MDIKEINLEEIIERALDENGIALDNADGKKITALAGIAEHLIKANSVMNLTAITDPEDIASKHIADSLTCLSYIPQGARLIDIGSGAGFPSLPIAVARPDLSVVALDSTAKKMSYISSTASELGLRNIKTAVGRAEEFCAPAPKGKRQNGNRKKAGGAKTAADQPEKVEYRERFDAACARAVARLNILCELALPFVKPGGVFIAMKSRLSDIELEEAAGAISVLGGELISCDHFSLKCKDELQERSIIAIKKVSRTPSCYPRQYSQISKKPL